MDHLVPLRGMVMSGSPLNFDNGAVPRSGPDIFPARAWVCRYCRKSRAAFADGK